MRFVLDAGQSRTHAQDPGSCDMMFSAWSEVLSKPALRPESSIPRQTSELEGIWQPITRQDVEATELAYKSAPGQDGITVAAWRKVPSVSRAAFFNIIRRVGRFPEMMAKGRTIFIPKKDGECAPLEHRPITVPSVIVRQFHKILAKRLLNAHDWDERQKAFINTDGCQENLTTLNAIFDTAKKRRKELHVASVDIAKAFDQVEHSAILEAVKRHGAPEAFVNYLRDGYGNMTTVLRYAGRECPVTVTRGVRQGDPLSPLLFNLVQENVIQKLSGDIGFRIDDQTNLNALCFADDTTIFSSTEMGLEQNLEILSRELKNVGLSLNPDKCAVISLKPSGREKKVKTLTEPRFEIDGKPLKQLGVLEMWRYLGIEYIGTQPLSGGKNYVEQLSLVSRSPLKPQQKLVVLKKYLIPRFMHGFVLGRLNSSKLKRLDVANRNAIRHWLKLPHDCPNGFFHSPVGEGGLGVMCLRTRIPVLKASRFSRLTMSRSRTTRAVSQLEVVESRYNRARASLSNAGIDTTVPSEQLYWTNKLHSSVDGKDLRYVHDFPASRFNIETRVESKLSGRDFVSSIHTRINCLPAKARTMRGREGEISCRAGCNASETSYHIIQTCPRTHHGRCLRHNKICQILASNMRQHNMIVHEEPRIRIDTGEYRKPDLLVVYNGQIFVIDVQVVSSNNMRRDYGNKVAKYTNAAGFNESVNSFLNVPGEVHHIPATLSYKGVWYGLSGRQLRTKLGVSMKLLSTLSKVAIKGSYLNFITFNKTTARTRRRPQ